MTERKTARRVGIGARIVSHLGSAPEMDTYQVAAGLGLHKQVTNAHLQALAKRGLVERVRRGVMGCNGAPARWRKL